MSQKEFKQQMKIRNKIENLMSMIDDIKDQKEKKQIIKYVKELLRERS